LKGSIKPNTKEDENEEKTNEKKSGSNKQTKPEGKQKENEKKKEGKNEEKEEGKNKKNKENKKESKHDEKEGKHENKNEGKHEQKGKSEEKHKDKKHETKNEENKQEHQHTQKSEDTTPIESPSIKKLEKTEIVSATNFNINEEHDNKYHLENVQFVPSLSAAGKASLEMTKDTEYLKIVGKGYETPSFSSEVIKKQAVDVTTPNVSVDYKWSGANPDANFWQNVEYHRYGQNIMEAHQYVTPAKYTLNEDGSAKVDAPQDSGLQIITKVPQIQAINFLGLGEKDTMEEEMSEKRESLITS